MRSGIDGFTIRHTTSAGISCTYSSPTLSNNTIADCGCGVSCIYSSANVSSNTVTGSNYCGIYCGGGAPLVSNNTVTLNDRSGICCTSNSCATICNNRIISNVADDGGGICCTDSSPTIYNNAITSNTATNGGGIYCSNSSPTIVNNTIAPNTADEGGGIYCTGSSPTISNNIVAFNSSGLYNDSTSGTPVLVNNCLHNPAGYDYQGIPAGATDIQADPELVAAQYGQVHIQPDSPCKDAGDDAVVQAGWVDMDGQARIQGLHVDIGADESDGTTWTFTLTPIHVAPSGDDGNDGTSWESAKRTVQAGIDAASPEGGEIWVAGNSAHPYFGHVALKRGTGLYGGFCGNEVSREQRDWRTNVTVLDGNDECGGIVAADFATANTVIDGFTIRNGNYYQGAGIFCSNSSLTISHNILTGNRGDGAGIYSEYGSPTIVYNRIVGNTSYNAGGGIYCYYDSATIANNVIAQNSAWYTAGGIDCLYGSAHILNNTITSNTADTAGAIRCSSCSPAIVSNNIVSFNSSGVYWTGPAVPILRNNCVYNPDGYDYSGLPAGAGDISLDPLLTSDYHLLPASPCVNAGWSDAVGIGVCDIDGQARLNGVVDIGSDEYWAGSEGVKLADDGSQVCIDGIVTAAWTGFFYVESPDRVFGIRCNASAPPHQGQRAVIYGTMATVGGERTLTNAQVVPGTLVSAPVPEPLFLSNSALGGGAFGLQQGITDVEGLNNIGLLVRTTGKVVGIDTASPPAWFTIDDGSGVNVKCVVPDGVTVNPAWSYVTVTGISSCEIVSTELHSLLRVRTQGDIVAY